MTGSVHIKGKDRIKTFRTCRVTDLLSGPFLRKLWEEVVLHQQGVGQESGCWDTSTRTCEIFPREGPEAPGWIWSREESQGYGSEAGLELNCSQKDAAKNNINRPLRDCVTILRGGFRQGREFRDRLVTGT